MHRTTPANAKPGQLPRLGDFTTDRRVLMLIAMALVVGTGATAAAWLLLRAIALVTNLVWFQTFGTQSLSLASLKPSLWMVVAPALGGLIIGLMARFGSEKIRGHGIPEAIEAILIGGSRMQPKVAVLKPLSSAISIGTGGPFGAEGPIIMTGGAIGSLFAQCFQPQRRRAQDPARCRRRRRHDGDLRHADRRGPAGGRAAAVRMETAQPASGHRRQHRIHRAGVRCCSAAARCFRSPAISTCRGGDSSSASASVPSPDCNRAFSPACSTKCEDLFGRLPMHWMWWPAIGGLVVGLGGLSAAARPRGRL